MVGVSRGRSSHAMMRVSSSAVLFVILVVPLVTSRGCTRESKGTVGKSIQGLIVCELLIVLIVTLEAIRTIVGRCGRCSG